MASRTKFLTLIASCAALLILLVSISPAQALIPLNLQMIKYINPDDSVTYWETTNNEYPSDTLPNEWVMSWSADAIRAGAVIIRSGAYWRTNRSELGSVQPNNNCYQISENGSLYYEMAPFSRGGHEEWIPLSRVQASIDASNATYQYHAERVSLPDGRPDKLVSLHYNSTIQNRTNGISGTWLTRIRYAYTGSGHPGSPYNPNVECSQSDSQTSTDPTYPNY